VNEETVSRWHARSHCHPTTSEDRARIDFFSQVALLFLEAYDRA